MNQLTLHRSKKMTWIPAHPSPDQNTLLIHPKTLRKNRHAQTLCRRDHNENSQDYDERTNHNRLRKRAALLILAPTQKTIVSSAPTGIQVP